MEPIDERVWQYYLALEEVHKKHMVPKRSSEDENDLTLRIEPEEARDKYVNVDGPVEIDRNVKCRINALCTVYIAQAEMEISKRDNQDIKDSKYKMALAMAKQENKPFALGIIYMFNAEYGLAIGDIGQAIVDYTQSCSIFSEMGFHEKAAQANINLAAIYLEQKDYQQAQPYLRDALTFLNTAIGELVSGDPVAKKYFNKKAIDSLKLEAIQLSRECLDANQVASMPKEIEYTEE